MRLRRLQRGVTPYVADPCAFRIVSNTVRAFSVSSNVGTADGMPGQAMPLGQKAGKVDAPNEMIPLPFDFSSSDKSERLRKLSDLIFLLKLPDTIITRWLVTPYDVFARCLASTRKRPKMK